MAGWLTGSEWARACLALAVVLSAGLEGCARSEASRSPRLAANADIPGEFPRETRLRLGDPAVQKQLQVTGGSEQLPFRVEWQNISGGPATIEAFRAGVLDGGSVGDTPPIHATFTGLDVKIVAVQSRDKPIYQLAIAPGTNIRSLLDLRGKKIGYSPGQAQGALVLRVLRKLGLERADVQLVQLTSTEFKDALASRQVDMAPLSGTTLLRYLNDYRSEGARSLEHGVFDSLAFFYVRAAVLENPEQAAALREYVKRRTAAQLWAVGHPEQWLESYYVKDQGLSLEEGRYVIETSGRPQYPGDWTAAIALTQETIDLLAESTGQARFDANTIFDRRFQTIAAEIAGGGA